MIVQYSMKILLDLQKNRNVLLVVKTKAMYRKRHWNDPGA